MVYYCFTNIQRFNDVELPWPRCFHGSGEEHHCIESPWALTTTGNPPRISSTAGSFLIPFRRLYFLLDTTCSFSSWVGLKIRVLNGTKIGYPRFVPIQIAILGYSIPSLDNQIRKHLHSLPSPSRLQRLKNPKGEPVFVWQALPGVTLHSHSHTS